MKYYKLEITVNDMDIVEHCCDNSYCPIVEAVDRATNGQCRDIALGRAHIYIDGLAYRLPSEAIGLVNALYNKPNPKLIKPLTFKLGEIL